VKQYFEFTLENSRALHTKISHPNIDTMIWDDCRKIRYVLCFKTCFSFQPLLALFLYKLCIINESLSNICLTASPPDINEPWLRLLFASDKIYRQMAIFSVHTVISLPIFKLLFCNLQYSCLCLCVWGSVKVAVKKYAFQQHIFPLCHSADCQLLLRSFKRHLNGNVLTLNSYEAA